MKKVVGDNEISKIKSKNIVLVGGCFDIIHPGHLKFLELSKQQGKTLVVLLESDERIRELKGNDRPVNSQTRRAKNLANLRFVDYVVLLNSSTSSEYYYNLVKLLEPDIIAVTAEDPLLSVKKAQAKMVSGKVVEVMKRDIRHSSTELIKTKKTINERNT